MKKDYLTYEEFGAIGDGKTDDMPAIVACHEEANKKKMRVKATAGAEYYIGEKNLTACIKTSTDFSTAKFIIDDRTLDNIKCSVFSVESDYEYFTPDITSLSPSQKKIDFLHTGNVYVRIFTDSHKIYIRKGLNQNAGNDPSDCFTVDNDGNILNEINWNYPTVSKIYAKCIDDEPITIEGGVFVTIANRAPSKYTYHKRNFNITRSNVTIKNLNHYIIGELDHGAPYEGFISVSESCNFLGENLLLTPHLTYRTESQIPGKDVSMGTYDLSFDGAINVNLKKIKQTIDITDGRYWGLMGSNFSKEVHLEDCVMSRFDAHCGVTNASIKNTVLGHQGLNLIGFGKFVIENSTVHSNVFINFRPDYGSFFNGELVIKNCIWAPPQNIPYSVFGAYNTGDHNFGYKCMLPKSITVSGLKVIDKNSTDAPIFILPNYDKAFSHGKPFEYGIPEEITISDIKFNSSRALEICEFAEQYLDTQAVTR